MAVQTSPIPDTGKRVKSIAQENHPKMEPRLIAANRRQKMPINQFCGAGNRLQMTQFEDHGMSDSFPRAWRHFSKSKPSTFSCP
jgi:hypothetical protein